MRSFQTIATLNELSIFLDQKNKAGSQSWSQGPDGAEVKVRLQGGVIATKGDPRKSLLTPAGGYDSHGLHSYSNGERPGCLLVQGVSLQEAQEQHRTPPPILDSVLDEAGWSSYKTTREVGQAWGALRGETYTRWELKQRELANQHSKTHEETEPWIRPQNAQLEDQATPDKIKRTEQMKKT